MAQFKPSKDALVRKVDEEAVLMDLASGKYFSLNGTGAVIWDLIVEGADTDDIAQKLPDIFSIDLATARDDTANLVAELQKAGLILAAE
jgi:Coenzyme PQQ synthesis protein D (PqqD)